MKKYTLYFIFVGIGFGDGFNDYLLKKSGKVSSFFAFTENVHRKKVCAVADRVLTSFDEYINIFN